MPALYCLEFTGGYVKWSMFISQYKIIYKLSSFVSMVMKSKDCCSYYDEVLNVSKLVYSSATHSIVYTFSLQNSTYL